VISAIFGHDDPADIRAAAQSIVAKTTRTSSAQ